MESYDLFVLSYPEWVHGIGYFLILVAAAQFPVWAVLQMLYYLCHPKKKVKHLGVLPRFYLTLFSVHGCVQTHPRVGPGRQISKEIVA